MSHLPLILALLAWAFLASLCFGEILPEVLKKAKTTPQRATAHVLCAVLSVLVGLLLPIRWLFPNKGE